MEATCAICTNNYLPYAKTLYSSLRQSGNTYPHFLLVFDSDSIDLTGFDEIIPVKIGDLKIEGLETYLKKYTVNEMAVFVRPFLYEYLLAEKGIEKLIYLDSDVYVTGSLSAMFRQLDGVNILLSPHITDYDIHPDKLPYVHYMRLFQFGIYNSGFYGFKNCSETTRFLRWLRDKAGNYFFFDTKHFMFFDQKWLELARLEFNGISVYNGKELNVANWNLHERKVELQDGKYYVDGTRMVFFHFSTFPVSRNPMHLSRYGDRDVDFSLPENKPYKLLAEEYADMLYKNNYEEDIGKPYGYSRFLKKKRKKQPLVKRIISKYLMHR